MLSPSTELTTLIGKTPIDRVYNKAYAALGLASDGFPVFVNLKAERSRHIAVAGADLAPLLITIGLSLAVRNDPDQLKIVPCSPSLRDLRGLVNYWPVSDLRVAVENWLVTPPGYHTIVMFDQPSDSDWATLRHILRYGYRAGVHAIIAAEAIDSLQFPVVVSQTGAAYRYQAKFFKSWAEPVSMIEFEPVTCADPVLFMAAQNISRVILR